MTVKEYNEIYSDVGACKVVLNNLEEIISDKDIDRLCTLVPDNFVRILNDALDEAVEALKMQIPRLPHRTSIDISTDFNLHCPCCGYKFISNVGGQYVAGQCSRFCPNCGQAMRWS